jgi:hypothetical protein
MALFKPKYQGELVLETIEKPTTVYFDEFGIPHIYANNPRCDGGLRLFTCARSTMANGVNA